MIDRGDVVTERLRDEVRIGDRAHERRHARVLDVARGEVERRDAPEVHVAGVGEVEQTPGEQGAEKAGTSGDDDVHR